MAKLPKFTLTSNEKKGRWDLTNDATNRVVKTFPTKTQATKGGVLQKAVGKAGGSVKIQKINGRFQEKRTYSPATRSGLISTSKQKLASEKRPALKKDSGKKYGSRKYGAAAKSSAPRREPVGVMPLTRKSKKAK